MQSSTGTQLRNGEAKLTSNSASESYARKKVQSIPTQEHGLADGGGELMISGAILRMRTHVLFMQWPPTDSARIKSSYLDTTMRISSKTAKLKLATDHFSEPFLERLGTGHQMLPSLNCISPARLCVCREGGGDLSGNLGHLPNRSRGPDGLTKLLAAVHGSTVDLAGLNLSY
jgi:hypothetical protein